VPSHLLFPGLGGPGRRRPGGVAGPADGAGRRRAPGPGLAARPAPGPRLGRAEHRDHAGAEARRGGRVLPRHGGRPARPAPGPRRRRGGRRACRSRPSRGHKVDVPPGTKGRQGGTARGCRPPGVLTGSLRWPAAYQPGSGPSRPGSTPPPNGTRAVVTCPRAVRCVGRCVRSRLAEVRFVRRCGGPKRARRFVLRLLQPPEDEQLRSALRSRLPVMGLSVALVVCTKNGTGALSGAQTVRRGGAGSVRGLLGGKDPTGRFRFACQARKWFSGGTNGRAGDRVVPGRAVLIPRSRSRLC
jgi:hypothetical protein